MDTLSVTTSDLHRINPAASLEYLVTLISQQMTPTGVNRAPPKEQIDAPLTVTDSKLDDDIHGSNIEALIGAIPPSPTPDFDDLLSPPPTPSAIAEIPTSCPFDDYALWGAFVTSTPHVVSKTNTTTNAIPTHHSPSLSDSDISEIQIIPRRLGARYLSPSTSSTSRDEDSLSSYSSPSAGSPLIKEKEKDIAHEYELLSSWLTELRITAPVVDAQTPAPSTNNPVPTCLDFGDSPMDKADHSSSPSDDAHEASYSKQDTTTEIAEPIQHTLAPKVSYSLLRHFEDLDASFKMTPPKLPLSSNTTALASASPSTTSSRSRSPSPTKPFYNTPTRPSEKQKQTTTPKMLKFKRDLTRKTRRAKKGLLEFSWKMKNRLQEQYNVSFRTNGAGRAGNGMRIAGCRGDFGCIVNEASFGFNPPALDWSFEVPAGYASAKGLAISSGTVPLKASHSSAFPSLKSVPDMTNLDLDEKLKAINVRRVPDFTTQASASSAIPAIPSMATMSSWSFSTDHDEEDEDEEGCQSPMCAGSGSEPTPETNHCAQSQTVLLESSDLAQPASSIMAKDDKASIGFSTGITTDVQRPTATPSCSHAHIFSIHPQISVPDNVSISARCNSPASASSPCIVINTTDAAPRVFDLKLDLELEFEHGHGHDTSTLHDGVGGDSLCADADDKGPGKGKQGEREQESVSDCTTSEVTDYLGLPTFASTLTSPNRMLSESSVRLPGAYIFSDGELELELDASRSFSAALGRAYKALFEQATVGA
ncbi:hypothetical protein BJ165DRAFT_1532279 [Panaeolus papilionaceus]|nr:hypothetical protein BJ165DRAFT_1532279 [Panaeolus papilionaceus]